MKRLMPILHILLALSLVGCASFGGSKSKPLRIGVKADYPPIVFKQGEAIVGAEAEIAIMIGARLGRRVEFIELSWDHLTEQLVEGKIDLIMAGMTITESRRIRIGFTDPYLKIGLMPLVRRKDAARFGTPQQVLASTGGIGVQQGSTADVFVQQHFPSAQRIPYDNAKDAALELARNRRIDIYIDDAPSIWWLASEHEADLVSIPILLTEDSLAFGVAMTNVRLKRQVDDLLAEWKQNGMLRAVLKRWLPIVE